jgi:hypothetical protein
MAQVQLYPGVIVDIVDNTTLEGLRPETLRIMQSMGQAALAAGLSHVQITAGHGTGGHVSHWDGTEVDLVGFNADGTRWTQDQRIAIAGGAREAGANRFGFYSNSNGSFTGNSLHVGTGPQGQNQNSYWGYGGATSGDSARAFSYAGERDFMNGVNTQPGGYTNTYGSPTPSTNAPGSLTTRMNETFGAAPVTPVEATPLAAPVTPNGITVNPAPMPPTERVGMAAGLIQTQISYDDIYPWVRNPTPPEQAQARRDAEGPSVGLWQAVTAATDRNWITNYALKGDVVYDLDPNFRFTEESMAALVQDLPENYWDMIGGARSESHAQFLRQYALDDIENARLLQSMGLGGSVLEFASMMLDPGAIAAGIATGGIGYLATKGAQLGRIAQRGINALLVGGAEGAYQAAGVLSNRPQSYGSDILMGAAMGAGLGFLFSPNLGNALIRNETAGMARAAEAALSPTGRGSVGAARAGQDTEFLTDEAAQRLMEMDAPETAFARGRISVAAQLGSSPSNQTRHLAGLVHDAVGKKNGALNPISVSEERTLFFRQDMIDWARTNRPAYDEWAKAKELGPAQRNYPSSRQQFHEEVFDFIVNRDPSRVFNPGIEATGRKARAIFARKLEELQNPMGREGIDGRPVGGTETVETDPYYVPEMMDPNKINQGVIDFGEPHVVDAFMRSIEQAQPGIKRKTSEMLAKAIVKRAREMFGKIEDDLAYAFSRGDIDNLKRILEESELSKAEIDEILSLSAPKKAADGGTDSRTKHRILKDINYEGRYETHAETGLETPNGGMLKLSDMYVKDINRLMTHYLQWANGARALARFRVKDPKTGELLIDGITKDSEFAKILASIKAEAADTKDAKRVKIAEREVKLLQFVYDHIKGRPAPADTEKYAEWLRLARKFNVLRVGGQFGFAQINEFANLVTQVGIKAAFAQMPALRRIRNLEGESVLRDGFADELEVTFGVGGDRMTGVLTGRQMDHLGGVETMPSDRFLGKANDVLEQSGRAVMDISGMRPVTMIQQRWANGAIVQNITNMAFKGSISKSKIKRMRELGLDDAMTARIFEQTKKHFKTVDGVIFKRKVKSMNLDKWDDLEARAMFENAVARWTRRVIQENDVGNLSKWMSHPFGQVLMQFRTFMAGAWEKQFLHNIKMHDWESFVYFSASMVWSAATYTAWRNVASIGRSDRDEYLAKNLTFMEIAQASFSRSGWASILPMGWDTLMGMTGQDPAFDNRTSGQTQDAFFGNPTTGLLSDVPKAMGGVIGSLVSGDNDLSQTDLRNLLRIVPFQNSMPFVQTFNWMIGGLPETNTR